MSDSVSEPQESIVMGRAEEKQRPRRSYSFWPREHGAYVQLLGPLLSALVFGPVTPLALVLAGVACAAFLAHEPLLLLLGQRGPKLYREHACAARWRLALLSALVLTLAALAWVRHES